MIYIDALDKCTGYQVLQTKFKHLEQQYTSLEDKNYPEKVLELEITVAKQEQTIEHLQNDNNRLYNSLEKGGNVNVLSSDHDNDNDSDNDNNNNDKHIRDKFEKENQKLKLEIDTLKKQIKYLHEESDLLNARIKHEKELEIKHNQLKTKNESINEEIRLLKESIQKQSNLLISKGDGKFNNNDSNDVKKLKQALEQKQEKLNKIKQEREVFELKLGQTQTQLTKSQQEIEFIKAQKYVTIKFHFLHK